MMHIPSPKYAGAINKIPETPTCGINSTESGFLGCDAFINKKKIGQDKRTIYIEKKRQAPSHKRGYAKLGIAGNDSI